MAKDGVRRRVHWYGVSEETVRWLALIVLIVVGLVALGGAYRQWDERNLRRRATETLERTRGLIEVVRDEGGAYDQEAAFREASGALTDARQAFSEGDYRTVLSRAEVSHGLLVTILDSIRNPGRGGDARFIYVEGEVELRRGETGSFRPARTRDVLYEGDYVRSSSRGSAEILFGREGTLFTVRPDTLLKVNRTRPAGGRPQSVGVQYGWVDLDTNKEESEVETASVQVTVAERTEASVALDRENQRGRFQVESGEARLAANDSGEVVELDGGQQVVHADDGFGQVGSLPPKPEIEGPPNDEGVNLDRRREVSLVWEPVASAAGGYALQVARSRLFTENVIEVDNRRGNSARLGIADEGAFYWRVAARDARGVRGPWSETRRFRVLSTGGIFWEDQEAPILEIEDLYVNGNILILKGRTEPGVRLDLDGQDIPVNADGSFSRSIAHPRVGRVTVVATAVDAAGNQTVEQREVLIEDI